jgi:UDP-N-acetyl-D-glucosamine dehydrogenase
LEVSLKEKIFTRNAILGVVGLGYVGLPLAIEFCKAGYKVIGLDTNAEKVQTLLEGESYVLDVPSDDVSEVIRNQRFLPTTDFDRLNDVDTVSICVPTPLRKSKEPDVSYIVSELPPVSWTRS